ncbi:peptidoglycan bridge formation glycyltransferase FemA/FemB family protein [Pseudopelagicola sp. nBUS_20]|uniref:peptidoglycan bridge formation glycyltransferase FemA/FemB family protein n=1 Tax=Pseudopelagicola sp. nBUS_20 TaxID=3395317 RepID=UPI003EB96C21
MLDLFRKFNVLQIDSISSPSTSEWREIFTVDPTATPFQSPEWMCAIEKTGHFKNKSRLFRCSKGRVLLPLAMHSSIFKNRKFSSLPHGFGAGGFISDFELVKNDLISILEALNDMNARELSIRPNPMQISIWPDPHACWATTKRISHVLDISSGYDYIWKNSFHSKKRNRIRKAVKLGIQIKKGNDAAILNQFYSVYLRWSEIRAKQRNLPSAPLLWLARRREPKWKFDAVARELGSNLQVYVASHGSLLVAAAVFLKMGDSAVYWRGASDIELTRKFPGNDLLQNEMIRDACESHCSSYHMGESGGVESLMRFKKDFGAKEIKYSEFSLK